MIKNKIIHLIVFFLPLYLSHELSRSGKYTNTYIIKNNEYKCTNGLFYDIKTRACVNFSPRSFLGGNPTIGSTLDNNITTIDIQCNFVALSDCTKFSSNGIIYNCPTPLIYNDKTCACDLAQNTPDCVKGVRKLTNDLVEGNNNSDRLPNSEYIDLMCYVTNWSIYRNLKGQFKFLRDIDPNLCSTIIYAFAGVNNDQLIPYDPNVDILRNGYKDVISLKGKGKVKNILISFPGWSEKINNGIMSTFNKGKQAIDNFAKNTIDFLNKYDFDGVNLDFEMGYNCELFEYYVQQLSKNKGNKTITANLFGGKWSMDNNCSPNISKYLDYGLVMSYQLSGSNTYTSPWSTTDVKKAMDFVHEYLNLPKNKLYVGIAQWSWSLNAKDRNEAVQDLIGQMVKYPDSYTYEFTGEPLRIGNIEYCILNEKNIKYLTNTKTSYIDNNQNLRRIYMTGLQRQMLEIRNFVVNSGYAGGMVWNLDLSDFNNNCQCKKKYQDLFTFAYGITDENCLLW